MSSKAKAKNTKSNVKISFAATPMSERLLPNPNKRTNDEEEIFAKTGLEFNHNIRDFDLIPCEYNDVFDLFKQYYEALLCNSDILEAMKKDVVAYFANDDTGCTLANEKIANFQLPNFTNTKRAKLDAYNADERILHASTKIMLNADQRLVAKERILQGELVIVEPPTVFVKRENCVCVRNANLECVYCFAVIKERFVKCATCKIAIYCSNRCKNAALREYHFFECKASRNHYFNLSDVTGLALRMLLLGCNHNFDHHSPMHNGLTNKYRNVYRLYYDLFKITRVDVHKIMRSVMISLIYLIECTNFFRYLAYKGILADKTLYEQILYVGGLLLMHNIQALRHTIYLPAEEFSFIAETNGFIFNNPGIFITTSYLKHYCDPNVVIMFKQNHCIVKALKDIHPNEHIQISYTKVNTIPTLADKQTLKLRDAICFCEKRCGQYGGLRSLDLDMKYKCLSCKDVLLEIHSLCPKCHMEIDTKTYSSKRFFLLIYYRYIAGTDFSDEKEVGKFMENHHGVLHTVTSELITGQFQVAKGHILNGNVNAAICNLFMLYQLVEENLHVYSIILLQWVLNAINLAMKTILYLGWKEILIENARYGLQLIENLCIFYDFKEEYLTLAITFGKFIDHDYVDLQRQFYVKGPLSASQALKLNKERTKHQPTFFTISKQDIDKLYPILPGMKNVQEMGMLNMGAGCSTEIIAKVRKNESTADGAGCSSGGCDESTTNDQRTNALERRRRKLGRKSRRR